MARDGYRIFDSDTHVGPDARVLATISARPKETGCKAGNHTNPKPAPATRPTPGASAVIAAAWARLNPTKHQAATWWHAATLPELARYVDHDRTSHYLDGQYGPEFLFRNDLLDE